MIRTDRAWPVTKMSAATKPILLALAACLAACGDNHVVADDMTPDLDAAIDTPPEYTGPCWPEGPMPATQASATLGTGRGGFEPMPDVLPIEWGFQDGFMFITSVRMRGVDPGDPKDALNPFNPRTRIRAFFADTGVPLNRGSYCPFRTGYVDVGNGEYEIVQEIGVVFETCWRSDRLIGKQFRIELEITDYAGATFVASDTKIVTAGEPLADEGDWPRDYDSPGCL